MDKAAFKEKWDNFWYYYKVHVLVGIFIIVVVVYSIVEAMGSKGCALNVTMVGKGIAEDKRQAFQVEATQKFVKDPKKEVVVEFLYYNPDNPDQTTPVTVSKVVAEIAAKDIDILVTDRQMFDSLAKDGAFLRIDNISGLSVLKSPPFKLINGKDENGNDYPCGIDADGIQTLKDIGYDTPGKVLCIPVNSKRIQLGTSFLKWMLKI